MDQRGDEIHASTTEASGGSREGVVRWVLIIGLLLVVALLSIIWITGALTQPEEDSHYNVSRELQETGATDAERGEPIMPAPETVDSTAGTAGTEGDSRTVVHPEATATPGDAPAGDPTNTAQ